MGIKHTFVSTKDQGTDNTLVSKNEWNDDHDLTGFDILDIPTTESVTTLRLAPDGFGGVEWVDGGVDLSGWFGNGASVTVVGTGGTGGASPLQISAPGGIASGDLILLTACSVNSVINATGPTGATFTKVISFDTSSNEWDIVYMAIADGTETLFELTHSAGSEAAMVAVVYRGINSLYSFAAGHDTMEAPAVFGHPEGLHVATYMIVNSGTYRPTMMGDMWTEDVYYANGGSYDCKCLIVRRICRAIFDTPAVAFDATGGGYAESYSYVFTSE